MGYPIIKAARITNLTDARYFAAKDVAFLGFNLEEGTEGYLDPIYMKAMREWVEGPGIVGEYVHAPAEVVAESARFFALDAVQVPIRNHSDNLDILAGVQVILHLEWPVLASDLLQICANKAAFVAYFLLDITPEHWPIHKDLLKTLCAQYPVLLQIELPTETVQTILEEINPAGLNLSGGAEEKVGVKSFDELDTIFDFLEQEN